MTTPEHQSLCGSAPGERMKTMGIHSLDFLGVVRLGFTLVNHGKPWLSHLTLDVDKA
jgi:hypothetical protein